MRSVNLVGRSFSPRVALGLEGIVTSWTDAKGPEVIESSKALVKGLRRVLSVRGRGRPSAPGRPPHRQTGRLARSVNHGLRGGERVVAITDFKGLFQEEGVETRATLSSGRRRRQGRVARRAVRIPPRPFMQAGFEAARDEMTNTTVAVARIQAGKLVVG